MRTISRDGTAANLARHFHFKAVGAPKLVPRSN